MNREIVLPKEDWFHRNTLLYGVSGSHSYGTNLPGSDLDYKGIFVLPENNLYSMFPQKDTYTLSDPVDLTMYDIRKFFVLGAKCNPNILELLWLDSYLIKHDIADSLLDIRQEFLSKKAFKAYAGYAESQKQRLTGYRNNSDTRKELREKFGYDTKFGMHLIRLLRMLCEILESGEVVVRRPDATQLLQIRNGALSLNELLAEALALQIRAEQLFKDSTLPDDCDYEYLNRQCIRIQKDVRQMCPLVL